MEEKRNEGMEGRDQKGGNKVEMKKDRGKNGGNGNRDSKKERNCEGGRKRSEAERGYQ